MSASVLATAWLGITLLTLTIAGLLLRGRVRLCVSFFALLLSVLVPDVLMLLWPKRFYTETLWTLKETLQTLLYMTVAAEIAIKTLHSFPRRRTQMIGLLVMVGGLTGIAISAHPQALEASYKSWLGEIAPICSAGTLWLFASVLVVTIFSGIPLHPFHLAVVVGFVVHLSFATAALTAFGTFGLVIDAILGVIPSVGGFILAELLWLTAAWRPLPELQFEDRRVMQTAQPWASW